MRRRRASFTPANTSGVASLDPSSTMSSSKSSNVWASALRMARPTRWARFQVEIATLTRGAGRSWQSDTHVPRALSGQQLGDEALDGSGLDGGTIPDDPRGEGARRAPQDSNNVQGQTRRRSR